MRNTELLFDHVALTIRLERNRVVFSHHWVYATHTHNFCWIWLSANNATSACMVWKRGGCTSCKWNSMTWRKHQPSSTSNWTQIYKLQKYVLCFLRLNLTDDESKENRKPIGDKVYVRETKSKRANSLNKSKFAYIKKNSQNSMLMQMDETVNEKKTAAIKRLQSPKSTNKFEKFMG